MTDALINILYYLSGVLSQSAIFYFFDKLSDNKMKKSKTFFIIIAISSLIEIFLANTSSIINGIVYIIYILIVTNIFSKIQFKDTLLYIVIIWLFGILIDIFMMHLYNLISPYTTNINIVIIKLTGTFLMAFSLILLAKMSLLKKLVNKIKKYVSKINFSYIYLVVILLIYLSLEAITILNLQNNMIVEMILIFSILLGLILLKFFSYQYDIITLKEMNKFLIHNDEIYLKLIDNYRILKHNLINQLLGVKSFSNKKAKLLIDDLIKEYNENFNFSININKIPKGINGIIYEKISEKNIKDLQLTIDNKIESDLLNILSPRSYNLLCEALGVTLDNAIEAVSKSTEKFIYLYFKEEEQYVLIKIMNSFEGNLDLEQIGELKYTTKNTGHGLGLYSLIGLKKLNIKTSIKNNIFINEIKILKK